MFLKNKLTIVKKILILKYKSFKFQKNEFVLSRIACLGQDVYKELEIKRPLLNMQKGRIDYLLSIYQAASSCAKSSMAAPFLKRKDIIPLLVEQACIKWFQVPSPYAIYMDSFSELTDQLFQHKDDNWKFCSNFSDINHSENFNENFNKDGLLSIESLKQYYLNFFQLITVRYPKVPIVFLHFPVTLDNRKKFQDRYEAILSAVNDISKELDTLHSISIDDSVVDWPEEKIEGLEKFPYHYNKGTYSEFARKIRSLGIF